MSESFGLELEKPRFLRALCPDSTGEVFCEADDFSLGSWLQDEVDCSDDHSGDSHLLTRHYFMARSRQDPVDFYIFTRTSCSISR